MPLPKKNVMQIVNSKNKLCIYYGMEWMFRASKSESGLYIAMIIVPCIKKGSEINGRGNLWNLKSLSNKPFIYERCVFPLTSSTNYEKDRNYRTTLLETGSYGSPYTHQRSNSSFPMPRSDGQGFASGRDVEVSNSLAQNTC